jgi:hypothetical protein
MIRYSTCLIWAEKLFVKPRDGAPSFQPQFQKKKHPNEKFDQRLTEAPIKSNRTSEISWLKKWKEKKKEFEHLRGRAKKIKNVFTIDYSIGKTHRKLQLDAEPS